jgi:hypothetical protein
MGIVVAFRRRNIQCRNDVFDHEGSDDSVDKPSSTRVGQTGVKDKQIAGAKISAQLLRPLASITICQVLEIGIKVHALHSQMCWQADAECQKQGFKGAVGFLHAGMNRTSFGDRDVREPSGLNINGAVPRAPTDTQIRAHATE